jgi:hypothetical protein
MKKLINNWLLMTIIMTVVYSFLWQGIVFVGYLIGYVLGLPHVQMLELTTALGFVTGASLPILINYHRR